MGREQRMAETEAGVETGEEGHASDVRGAARETSPSKGAVSSVPRAGKQRGAEGEEGQEGEESFVRRRRKKKRRGRDNI